MRKFEPLPEELQPIVHSLELKAILVVDDDRQLTSALQWILVDENFLVDVAFDGEQAMMKVKAHEYDAVICDLEDAEAPRRRILSKGERSAAVSDRSVHIHHWFRGRSVDRALLQQARSEIFGETVSHRGAH